MGYAYETRAVKGVGWAEDQGVRNEMEDGFVFVDQFGGRPTSAFFAVYDGHGGRQVVDFVTRELHESILREVRKTVSVPDAMVQAFANTDNEMVYRRNITSSGCTACCCLLQEERHARVIYTAHLGDSRAVLARGGTATRLTSATDHKATDPLEGKRVIEAGGQIINDRVNGMLAMTRALGDHILKMPQLPNDVVSHIPDITSTDLNAQDSFVIVACDGLFDVVSDQEAVDLVIDSLRELEPWKEQLHREGRSLPQILARMLVEEALAHGSTDNVSCVVIFL
jgi:serine/threonine protein phosphatase PrpC